MAWTTGWPGSSSTAYPKYWSALTNDTWYKRNASYAKGVLSWYTEYSVPIADWGIDYTCSGGSATVGTSYYAGAYASKTSTTCGSGNYYDRWSFVAPATEYAYVSVDTLSEKTAFNPYMFLTGDGCFMNIADESFACTYPPKWGGNCPSFKIPVTAGVEYDVFVLDGGCPSSTIDYKIVVDTTGDPTLTLEASYMPRFMWAQARLEGEATITPP